MFKEAYMDLIYEEESLLDPNFLDPVDIDQFFNDLSFKENSG